MKTEKQEIACNIYRMIFDQCPEARQLFSFMNLDLNNCKKKNNDFVFQALRFIQKSYEKHDFMTLYYWKELLEKARQFQPSSAAPLQVLESGINSLDDLKAFDPILDNLGRRHGKLESSSGFRLYYWSVFLECSIHHIRLALLSSKADRWNNTDVDNVVILWRHLISGICERIKRGYLTNIADRSMLDVQAEVASRAKLSVIPPIPQPSAKNPGGKGTIGVTGTILSANFARMPVHYQFIRWLFSRIRRGD
ncbi:unnamed protein product [Brugia timori]|uniref:GLOBIN domain-containing protein n=1 Tax=Brugia timori TaxID=42155 RepID=A0A0R3QS75_9BILA|nr:unnamed protein product [Brugia timori]